MRQARGCFPNILLRKARIAALKRLPLLIVRAGISPHAIKGRTFVAVSAHNTQAPAAASRQPLGLGYCGLGVLASAAYLMPARMND